MSTKVRYCRNFVAFAGIFSLFGSIFLIVLNPTKWQDGLEMVGVAFTCWTIVGQVNRGEGDWHKEAFVKKREREIKLPRI